ncbi:hypothetical protein [Paracoccus alcaliphilus]|uniref:hypothetical protein n=1 Tax=Paracoccus alcaliphilus TaxID=34002 RepID=UPI000B8946CD|nr:hypothetical protein [Paracoccus alcaliphilus]WCR18392.1 hypothetical protein JHW40_01055 [Paracoccus alcaliphilus]
MFPPDSRRRRKSSGQCRWQASLLFVDRPRNLRDGDTLKLRQGKTNMPLVLPCTNDLKSALEEAKAFLF